ncbi:ParB/RepB/Spo0J family partition protein [Actinomycetaceae bacterium TAE3-ERU4]|nr:ParB/RepB/Spo0J family partition protein [Actinomycetaceae bacterium TAE3-ERU4]
MSTKKRGGLGRGLSALIPETQQETPQKQAQPLDVFFPAIEAIRDEVQKDSSEKGSVATGTKTDSRVRDLLTAPIGKRRRTAEGKVKKEDVSRETSSEKPSTVESTQVKEKADSRVNGGDKKKESSSKKNIRSNTSGKTAHVKNNSSENVSRETKVDTFDEVELSPVPGATFGEIPVWSIVANRAQPRTNFDADELSELVDSIREVGVLQPIVVRPLETGEAESIYRDRILSAQNRTEVPELNEEAKLVGDLESLLNVEQLEKIGPPRYELIMGERRLRSSRLAGLETIPAIVRHTEDSDLLRDALLENLHRVQLNPIEEAAAYQQLMEDFGCTQEQLSVKVARSRPQIANTLRLLRLPGMVQRMVSSGTISAGHARALLRLEDASQMQILAERIIAEGLSVRSVEEIVAMGAVRGTAAGKRAPKNRNLPEHLQRFATSLGDRLDTRVSVQLGKAKSKIIIESADAEDLERIIALLEK